VPMSLLRISVASCFFCDERFCTTGRGAGSLLHKLVASSVLGAVAMFLYYSLQRQFLFFKHCFSFCFDFPSCDIFIKFLLLLVECVQLETTPVIIDLLLITYEVSLIYIFNPQK
jgi:hypothetical protein